jgi:hypothetical protein|tara:strand:- start:67 stop:783 length:717 start_codon:yes stop_codon:yes gene_type:complete
MVHHIRSWHRTIGALAALFLLILAITGIILNHTLDFKLDERHLNWPWILEHYGVSDVKADHVYWLDGNVLSQIDDQLFVDANPVAKSREPIVGGIHLDEMTVIASEDALILLSEDGEYIETMSSGVGIPSDIQRIGLHNGLPILQTRNGMWRSDFIMEEWKQTNLEGVSWSILTEMPDSVINDLAAYFHGKGITIERFVLDIHNGHILGALGKWILDFFGFLMVLLSLSGLWMWIKKS